MLSTKNIIADVNDVPSAWVFEHYCNLQTPLTGQTVKITSVFKPTERTPSMQIFPSDNGQYYFKDFSSGNGGSGVDLVMAMQGIEAGPAIGMICKDYQEYLKTGGRVMPLITVPQDRYKVTSWTIRNWNILDAKFWQSFHIGSDTLEEYRVIPLSHYSMTKGDEGFDVSGREYVYGYFRKDGSLDKIYQPMNKKQKFINVGKGYVQGSDQIIKGKNDILLYVSSLKDVMCIKGFQLKIDLKAPGSENTMIPEETIKKDKKHYKKVLTLFDDDVAGINAMKRYKELYDIDFVYFNLAKDPSDATRALGPKKVTLDLAFKINSKIN